MKYFYSRKNKTLDELHAIWNDIPRGMKKNPDVICAYVKQLVRFNQTTEIEELIRKTLKTTWHVELVKIYSHLPFTNLNRQLVIVGAWVKIHGQQPELLLLLGRLCVQIQLWGKAKDYFEKCLSLGPSPEASLEYGKLFEQLDRTRESDAEISGRDWLGKFKLQGREFLKYFLHLCCKQWLTKIKALNA